MAMTSARASEVPREVLGVGVSGGGDARHPCTWALGRVLGASNAFLSFHFLEREKGKGKQKNSNLTCLVITPLQEDTKQKRLKGGS